jgi:hypothetical protein
MYVGALRWRCVLICSIWIQEPHNSADALVEMPDWLLDALTEKRIDLGIRGDYLHPIR